MTGISEMRRQRVAAIGLLIGELEPVAAGIQRRIEVLRVERERHLRHLGDEARWYVHETKDEAEYGFLVTLGGLCVEWRKAAENTLGGRGIAYRACADRLAEVLEVRKRGGS